MLTTKWIALPSWLFTKCCRPFLGDSHPWKKEFFTLADWHACREPFTRQFDLTLWIVIPVQCYLIWLLTTQL